MGKKPDKWQHIEVEVEPGSEMDVIKHYEETNFELVAVVPFGDVNYKLFMKRLVV